MLKAAEPVLNRHQPAQFVHVEVRVGFLTQRKADEGHRRKSSDQDIALPVVNTMAPGACRWISWVARSTFSFRVKLEDRASPAGELDSSSHEGLAILAPEYLPPQRRARQRAVSIGEVATISTAVIEIGYSRYDDPLWAPAFSDEEVAISARDARKPGMHR